MEKGDIDFLIQLAEALEEGGGKLEYFYSKNDTDKFHKTKKFILQINKKISEVLK